MSTPSLASPTRTDTLRSSDTTLSGSDDDSLQEPITSFDHFYTEAVAFQHVLVSNGCIEDRRPDQDGANGFEDLVAKDLTLAEQAAASRAAKLSFRATGAVPSWTPSPTSSISEEPETYTEEPDDSLDGSDESSTICDVPAPVLHRSGTTDSDAWKLEPEEVIRLIVNEFGPLAPEGEEEKLLLETDGGLIKDISILVSSHHFPQS